MYTKSLMPLKNLCIRRLAALLGKCGRVTAAFQQVCTVCVSVCACVCVQYFFPKTVWPEILAGNLLWQIGGF